MGLPRATAFRFGQGHFEAVFNFYFNSRRDQKRARQIHELERVAILFLGLRHDARNAPSCFKSSPETMKPQKAGRMTQTSTCWTGEDHFLESKKPMCLRPRKWDCCSDLFCEKLRSFNKKQYSCKCNGMAGFRGTRLLIEGLYPRLHVANLCQSTMLFGIVWVLLSQAFATWRGWGADSAATLLAGCFFLCLRWQWIVLSRLGVALLSFVLVSWCVVCFWAPPLRPPRLLTRQLCGSGCVCRPEFSIIRLKNNSIYLKPDESFVYSGGRVSISWLQQIP